MSTSTSISELAGFATDGLLDERLRVLAPVAVADYTFVSYVRSGLGAAIVAELHEDDPLTTTIDVSLTLWANAGPNGTQLASHSAVVYGPGDVIGFDAAQVIRRYPAPGGAEANPNDLAMVEFDTPELPWLFTPAAPSADGRHTPWIGLVCVEDPFGMRLLSAGRRGNPSLWLDGNEQPDLGDAWAWAHAQVLGTPEGPAIVEQLGRGNRVANLSRLICPRRLRPNTSYLAAIVPLFEAGRQAGLGQPVEEAHKHRAWHCTASVEVPVYDSFSFRTGEAADLEALARRIVGTKATAGVGRLRLDVHSPSETITVPAESAQVHILEGPLLGTTPSDGSRYPATQQTQLTDALGRTSEATLRPPTYGAAHLALPELPDEGGPAWLEELNCGNY